MISVLIKIWRWLVRFFGSIGEDFAKKAFLNVAGKIIAVLIPTFFAARGVSAGYDFVAEKLFGIISDKDRRIESLEKENRIHETKERRLADSINTLAASKNYFDADTFRDQIVADLSGRFNEKLSVVMSKLEKADQRIVELTVTVISLQSINRRAEVVESRIDDGYLRGTFVRDTVNVKDLFDYGFTFKIRETVLTSEDENGEREDVYNVFAVSSKDTNDVTLLDNSHREKKSLVQRPEDLSLMWIDYAINGDVIVGDRLSAAISLTPFMITSGGRATKAVLVRYPELGVIIDGVSIFTGARFNVGHFLPLFQSTYVSGKIGYSFEDRRPVLRFGVGTTF